VCVCMLKPECVNALVCMYLYVHTCESLYVCVSAYIFCVCMHVWADRW